MKKLYMDRPISGFLVGEQLFLLSGFLVWRFSGLAVL